MDDSQELMKQKITEESEKTKKEQAILEKRKKKIEALKSQKYQFDDELYWETEAISMQQKLLKNYISILKQPNEMINTFSNCHQFCHESFPEDLENIEKEKRNVEKILAEKEKEARKISQKYLQLEKSLYLYCDGQTSSFDIEKMILKKEKINQKFSHLYDEIALLNHYQKTLKEKSHQESLPKGLFEIFSHLETYGNARIGKLYVNLKTLQASEYTEKDTWIFQTAYYPVLYLLKHFPNKLSFIPPEVEEIFHKIPKLKGLNELDYETLLAKYGFWNDLEQTLKFKKERK